MKREPVSLLVLLAWAALLPGRAGAEASREWKVHLAQAANDSPYAFVRAKFRPGEVSDPWAVRFLDEKGATVPFFVWDSVTWRVAREGRADWGRRYALLQHAPGDAAEAVEARTRKLQGARKNLPDLGARLDAEEQAARKAPDSVCAALYLLRHRVPALGKKRLTLRLSPGRQAAPKRRLWKGRKVQERISVAQGHLELRGLPDRLAVVWKKKELFRCAGFQAGDRSDTVSHADPARPFVVETVEGIITRVTITAQTTGRQGGVMDWQSTCWLFPEGSWVALVGFSLEKTAGYRGGPQKLCLWQTDGDFTRRRLPLWETPWWLHQAGKGGFVATHPFHATPLTIGFGNNPFAVNAEGPGKDPRVEENGNRLALTWFHRVDDPAIVRLMTPQPLPRPGAPRPAPPKPGRWQPGTDWLYRQYAAGIGEKAESAEGSLRAVLGAAAGWIDRPVSEEEVAALLVQMMPRIATSRESAEIGLLKIVPAVLADDPAAVREVLRRSRDLAERTDYYIDLIRGHVQRGGKPSEGRRPDDPDGTRREGWTGNPCYHAVLMPCHLRVLEHFEVPFRRKEYRQALLRYADFSLDLLGGKPLDFDRLNTTYQLEWPSRIVPIIPLVLHAHTLRPDRKYVRAARVLFDDLMRLVERNPHGYWPTWSFRPRADRFDTVYNPVGNERGVVAPWWEDQLAVIGRDRASRFAAAQARWFVFSGQLLDTLEMDNPTAIRASTHGGHTGLRNQVGLYLYDDFDFYRGLVADLVAWSAAASQMPGPVDAWGVGAYRRLELSNAGSSMLRWALGIRPGSKWLESRLRRLPSGGFRLEAWNRRPRRKPTVEVSAVDAGLKGKGSVLGVTLQGPAFRLPAEVEVSGTAGKVSLKVSRPARIRLSYRLLRPEWSGDRPVLRRRSPGGTQEVRAVWEKEQVEWDAAPGEYELRPGGR